MSLKSLVRSCAIPRLALSLFLLAGPSLAAAADEVALPDSLGRVKLGMTDDDLKKEYPGVALKVADATNSKPAPSFHYAEASSVDLGSVLGASNCKGRLQFYAHKLMAINVQCEDQAATLAGLKKNLGSPAEDTDEYIRWTSSARAITYSKAGGGFVLNDVELNKAFNSQLLLLTMQAQQQQGGQAPGGAAPAQPANP